MQRNIFSVMRQSMPIMAHRFMPKRNFISTSMMLQKEPTCSKLPPKLAKLQKQFQQNDGKPVYLKGGSMDSMLYNLTLVLCVVGTIGDLWLWFGYILA